MPGGVAGVPPIMEAPYADSARLQSIMNEALAELPAGGVAELSGLLDPAWIEQVLQATGFNFNSILQFGGCQMKASVP
jgi:hypothetical protein